MKVILFGLNVVYPNLNGQKQINLCQYVNPAIGMKKLFKTQKTTR